MARWRLASPVGHLSRWRTPGGHRLEEKLSFHLGVEIRRVSFTSVGESVTCLFSVACHGHVKHHARLRFFFRERDPG